MAQYKYDKLTLLDHLAKITTEDKQNGLNFVTQIQELITDLMTKTAKPSQETINSLEASGYSIKTNLTDAQITELETKEDKKREQIRADAAAAADAAAVEAARLEAVRVATAAEAARLEAVRFAAEDAPSHPPR